MNIDLEFMKIVFKNALDLNDYDLQLNSEFENVPGWDSLGHMKIVTEIEEKLKIEFDIDEIVGVDTVAKLIKMTKNKTI
jgi:acyl carrier protein